jgi:hypothetical protein
MTTDRWDSRVEEVGAAMHESRHTQHWIDEELMEEEESDGDRRR